MEDKKPYSNIRHFLGIFVGKTLLDVTQHDEGEFDPETKTGSFVELMFDNGGTIRFPIGDEPFVAGHPDDCECDLCKEQEAEREKP